MKSLASAVGGKTARACDSCVKRRGRWYCAADDAFLCQSCDASVHSANPLALRHERVRLKSASSGGSNDHRLGSLSPPRAAATWHHGFTRKPSTPRGGGGTAGKKNHGAIFHDLVPEISVEDQTDNYEEDQLICRVPVLDPMVADQYRNDATDTLPLPVRVKCGDVIIEEDNAESCLNGFFPTDMELEEFAADVETLLGQGLETECVAMDELGLGDGSSSGCGRSSSIILKVENEDVEEEGEYINNALSCHRDDVNATPLDLSFDYVSHKTCQEEEEEEEDKENVVNVNFGVEGEKNKNKKKKKKKEVLMLRLNFESVISSWGGPGPPWTPGGEPPELDLDNGCCPISMGGDSGTEVHGPPQLGGGCCGVGVQAASSSGDGGREARVSRYREKRRTRLFSKKIRYEVRKLNAEKRPRMKGRFVKRASLASLTSSSSPTSTNISIHI